MESQINSGRTNGKPHIWIKMYVMSKGVNFDEVYNEYLLFYVFRYFKKQVLHW